MLFLEPRAQSLSPATFLPLTTLLSRQPIDGCVLTAAAKAPVTTDEELMLDVRRGDREAFERLFDRYRDPMWRFFRRRVPDAARAEELAQDAFVAVLQGAARYEPRAPFRSYLFGIAYNLLLAERRKSSQQLVEPLDAEPAAVSASDPEAEMSVRSALALLEPDDREILMLREYEQLSYQEIAHLKKMPLNTVRSRLFRARMALKAVLERPVHVPVRVTPMKVTNDGR
jgi:RNA polymerase sigma-70 factor (ECF subfamily)